MFRDQAGGKGILLCGASGVPPAKIVILGAGVARANAPRADKRGCYGGA
jgi:alanine dehydrogenase